MPRPPIPNQVQILNIPLKSRGTGQGGVYATVRANVTVQIQGDASGVFQVDEVEADDVVRDPDSPPGHPSFSLQTARQVDGPGPIQVTPGEAILATVGFNCPADPLQAEFHATAVMDAPELPSPIQVPILATANLGTISGLTLITQPILPGGKQTYGIQLRSTLGHNAKVALQYNASFDRHFLSSGAFAEVPAGGSVNRSVEVTCVPATPPGLYDVIFQIVSQDLATDYSSVEFVIEVSDPGPGIDTSINWEQPNRFGIQVDAAADGWNSGRVHDVLSLPGGFLIVGVAKAGVWEVTPTGDAASHSDDWENPDVNCLEHGLDDPNHFYAGCDSGGALYESDPHTAVGLSMVWHPVPIVDSTGTPLGSGNVLRMAVVRQNRKLVLACSNGVFWANIPLSIGSPYSFTQALGLPPGTYSGVAAGPSGSVVVAAWGDGNAHFGIFFGDWTTGALVFRRMTVPDESKLFWISLASCDGDLNRIYAAASDANGALISFLRHDHASDGTSWKVCNNSVGSAPPGKNLLNSTGNSSFGGWIKTMRVSPTRPDVVVMNWARTFLSTSGGQAPWIAVDQVPAATDWDRNAAWHSHMHEDGHATVFDIADENILYITSDGGVGKTPDGGKTYFSKYNQHLATLMFSSQPIRDADYGTLAVAPSPMGLLAGGFQDNGDLYCQVSPNPAPWHFLRGGDGQGVQFLPVGQELIWYVNDGEGVKTSHWNGSSFDPPTIIPVTGQFPSTVGLVNPIMELVDAPTFRNASGQLMVAVGCKDKGGIVHGLFADSNGGNLQWQALGIIPPFAAGDVTAIASLSGDVVCIGMSDGRIFAMTASTGSFAENPTPRESAPGEVDRFVIMNERLAYATYNTATGLGLVLQLNLLGWSPLGSNSNVARGAGLPSDDGPFYAMAVDRDASPPTLFIATDGNVYDSRNGADSFRLARTGLPGQPHCSDLRIDRGDGTKRFLYLSTFGRSIWRAPLTSAN